MVIRRIIYSASAILMVFMLGYYVHLTRKVPTGSDAIMTNSGRGLSKQDYVLTREAIILNFAKYRLTSNSFLLRERELDNTVFATYEYNGRKLAIDKRSLVINAAKQSSKYVDYRVYYQGVLYEFGLSKSIKDLVLSIDPASLELMHKSILKSNEDGIVYFANMLLAYLSFYAEDSSNQYVPSFDTKGNIEWLYSWCLRHDIRVPFSELDLVRKAWKITISPHIVGTRFDHLKKEDAFIILDNGNNTRCMTYDGKEIPNKE